jgi:ribosomal RNA-processing protein 1
VQNRTESSRVPTSLTYHLSDIYLEELNRFLADRSEEAYSPPLSLLLEPFFAVLARTPSKATYTHVQSAVLQPLLKSFSAVLNPVSDAAEEREEDDDEAPPRKRPRLDTDADLINVCTQCALSPHSLRPEEPTLLYKALLKHVFDIASDSTTRDANRRRLYNLWKTARAEDDEDS